MKTAPLISVITVSFNQAQFIRQAIESVLAQDYPNIEHIVVDGGSTDGTVEILKSYPHLRWTSAPDKGQSDALNKGFQRASGEIIAWLNSDDWYAPGVFHDVAQALQDYPIVMGAAAQTDKDGNVTEIVENTPRGYFDLLRYWIPYAWIGQPSVFFTRELLESVRRPDGTYIDEDLYFTMDYDLWMRMALRYPFTHRIDKVLSYMRIYDSNKTGARPVATQRECSRVFRRYANKSCDYEQTISCIIPVDKVDEALRVTVRNILDQPCINFELLLVNYAHDKATSRAIHEFTLDLSESESHMNIRQVRSDARNIFEALNLGIEHACAPLVAFFQPGDTVAPEFSLAVANMFSREPVGVILPDIGRPEVTKPISARVGYLDPMGLMATPHFFPNLVCRRIVCLELGGFHSSHDPVIAVREFLLRAFHKGWAFVCGEGAYMTPVCKAYPEENSRIRDDMGAIAELLFANLEKELAIDPFAKVRNAVRPVTDLPAA